MDVEKWQVPESRHEYTYTEKHRIEFEATYESSPGLDYAWYLRLELIGGQQGYEPSLAYDIAWDDFDYHTDGEPLNYIDKPEIELAGIKYHNVMNKGTFYYTMKEGVVGFFYDNTNTVSWILL